jgi:hypothetical protein
MSTGTGYLYRSPPKSVFLDMLPMLLAWFCYRPGTTPALFKCEAACQLSGRRTSAKYNPNHPSQSIFRYFPVNAVHSWPVLRIRIRDPGSGAFLPPGSGIRIRDPDWSNGRIRDPGEVNKICKKEVGSGIRDPVLFYPPDPGSGSGSGFGMEQWSDPDPGSGIKHPGSATL